MLIPVKNMRKQRNLSANGNGNLGNERYAAFKRAANPIALIFEILFGIIFFLHKTLLNFTGKIEKPSKGPWWYLRISVVPWITIHGFCFIFYLPFTQSIIIWKLSHLVPVCPELPIIYVKKMLMMLWN